MVHDPVDRGGSSGTAAGSGYYGLLLPVVPANRTPGHRHRLPDRQLDDHVRFVVASAVVAVDLWAANDEEAIIVVTNAAGAGVVTGTTRSAPRPVDVVGERPDPAERSATRHPRRRDGGDVG